MALMTYAQACDRFPADKILLALKWFATDLSEFAQSLSSFYNKHDGLTDRQWLAAVDAAEGRTKFKPRRRSSTTGADSGATGDVPAPITNPRQALSPAQRSIVRKAITGKEGWSAYAQQQAITSAQLSGETLFAAADALGVNVADALAAAADASRAANADAFKRIQDKAERGEGGTSGATDWQRVRNIAREEVQARLEPVVKTVVIVEREGQQRSVEGATHHPEFDKLVRSATVRDFTGQRLNVLLVGPTGTGKSYACRQLAQIMGLPFFFQSQADESFALVGYERVNGAMKYTPFVTAFRDGGVCLLDEIDRYDSKALTALNAALANGAMTLDSGEVIKRHPDFVCVGAANTMGQGGSSDFTAAEKLDLSTISRFAVRLDWHVCRDTEDKIAAAKADNANVAALWLAEVREVRDAMARLSGLPYFADQRCVEAGANLLAAGMKASDVRRITYLAPLDDDQRAAVMAHVKTLVKDA